MDAQQYSAIPGTEDSQYWRLKRSNRGQKVQVFEPINPDLHRSLLEKLRSGRKVVPTTRRNGSGFRFNVQR